MEKLELKTYIGIRDAMEDCDYTVLEHAIRNEFDCDFVIYADSLDECWAIDFVCSDGGTARIRVYMNVYYKTGEFEFLFEEPYFEFDKFFALANEGELVKCWASAGAYREESDDYKIFSEKQLDYFDYCYCSESFDFAEEELKELGLLNYLTSWCRDIV